MTKLFKRGFTLIELLVTLAIIALLLSVATPRYFRHIEKSKEQVLHSNLAILRDSLGKYYEDTGKYPSTLEDLVAKQYLKSIPMDPVTEKQDTWILINEGGTAGGIRDIKSGAEGTARDGSTFSSW